MCSLNANFANSTFFTITFSQNSPVQGQHIQYRLLLPSHLLFGSAWGICILPPGGTWPRGSTLRGRPWGRAWRRPWRPCRIVPRQPSSFSFGDRLATDVCCYHAHLYILFIEGDGGGIPCIYHFNLAGFGGGSTYATILIVLLLNLRGKIISKKILNFFTRKHDS